MFMLTRGPGQAIDVTDTRTGESVMRITVQLVKGSQVRLGFEAPAHIHILRDDAIAKAPKERTAERAP